MVLYKAKNILSLRDMIRRWQLDGNHANLNYVYIA